ncbi:metallophosphoesterase family protein [Pseudobacteriovorax antillogorgiicola]|uniref:Calcineurin-like phosphoesterase n=1 Tax=Pseudobacteriovorax antillogorgiicola TaxID=1513793 RepID=A0A1Y6CAJ4_9BACT|nr:metallophosphoesterase [Pseudobacteriovorax antillogorgiicola]TCS49812.1 calcineurin-like phosphoesterase family protein [Pseudobacteriovorax antillogorgiicola]SMF43118.1 Calcineurin-like phosphoesterase [Pseudobacteriovorax antillogorgiicola]
MTTKTFQIISIRCPRKLRGLNIAALLIILLGSSLGFAEIRFLATADCQFENGNQDRKQSSNETFLRMFQRLDRDPGLHGVLVAGDLTQNSRKDEFEWYLSSIASHREDVFEGLGNHDVERPSFGQRLACGLGLGSCVYPDVIAQTLDEKTRNTSLNLKQKPHYSWLWSSVQLVHLNVFPADEPAPQFPNISPQRSLSFLKKVLQDQVHDKTQQIVLVHHYGFDPFSKGAYGEEWWTESQRRAYWEVLAEYNVAAIITGHVHLSPLSNNWYIPWQRPEGLGGPDRIHTFVAGGGLKGAYLEFSIDEQQVEVLRYGIGDQLIDQKKLDLF